MSVIPIKVSGRSHIRSMCVNTHHIFVTFFGSHYIYKMSLEGKEILKYGRYGTNLGEFDHPYACMCDDDENLLITNVSNRCPQLLHGEQWYEIELQPPPFWPQAVVYDGHALYVRDAYEIQKFKYEKEHACVLM